MDKVLPYPFIYCESDQSLFTTLCFTFNYQQQFPFAESGPLGGVLIRDRFIFRRPIKENYDVQNRGVSNLRWKLWYQHSPFVQELHLPQEAQVNLLTHQDLDLPKCQ